MHRVLIGRPGVIFLNIYSVIKFLWFIFFSALLFMDHIMYDSYGMSHSNDCYESYRMTVTITHEKDMNTFIRKIWQIATIPFQLLSAELPPHKWRGVHLIFVRW